MVGIPRIGSLSSKNAEITLRYPSELTRILELIDLNLMGVNEIDIPLRILEFSWTTLALSKRHRLHVSASFQRGKVHYAQQLDVRCFPDPPSSDTRELRLAPRHATVAVTEA